MRYLLPLLLGSALLVSACGQEEAPATISGGKPIASISQEVFDAWYKSGKIDVAQQCKQRNKSQSQADKCIASGSKTIRSQILNGLIGDAWVLNEAASLNISLSAKDKAAIKADTTEQVKRDPKRLQTKYVYQRSEAELLMTRLVDSQVKNSDFKINRKQAYKAYLKNKNRFNSPEARDFIFVTAPTPSVAKVVARRLRAGDSLKSVLKSLVASKNAEQEATITKVTKDGVPKEIRFVFDLPSGKVFGPKSISGKNVVAQVTKIYPAEKGSFKTAYPQIVRLAKEEYARQQVMAEIENKWRPKTTCAKGYSSPLCSNRPKQSSPVSG